MTIQGILGRMAVGDLHAVRIMGVINLGEESFYKGSIASPNRVLERAQAMVTEGADIIDLGAVSTAPGSPEISPEVESSRLLPALKLLKENLDVDISVDTQRSSIAKSALSAGACCINDVSGFIDCTMAEVVAEYDASAILMASRHRAGDLLAMREIIRLLGERLERAKSAGVDLDKVSIDPGIGRWIPAKSHRHDLALLNGLPRLRVLDRPIVAALSRKSFIGAVLGEPDPAMRLAGSLSAAALAVYNGAHILRTHDVAASLEIVRLAQAARGRPAVVQQGRVQVEVLGYHGHSGDLVQALQHLGVGEGGDRKLCEKGSFRVLKVSGLASPEALIIKQEMLARGGDAAISKETLLCDPTPQRIMIFGTERQIASLMHKLKDQPLGLPAVALALEQALKQIDDVDRFG